MQAVGPEAVPDWYVPADGAGFAVVWPALVAFSSPDDSALAAPATTGSGGGWTHPGGGGWAHVGGGGLTHVGGGAGGSG